MCEHDAKRVIFSLMVWTHDISSALRQVIHSESFGSDVS